MQSNAKQCKRIMCYHPLPHTHDPSIKHHRYDVRPQSKEPHVYMRFLPFQRPRRILDVGRGISLWLALHSSPVAGPLPPCRRRHSRRNRPTRPSAKLLVFFCFLIFVLPIVDSIGHVTRLHHGYIVPLIHTVTCSY